MSPTSNRQKVGLVLAGLISAISVSSAFFPAPDGDDAPPLPILILGSVLGVIGLVAVIIAWRSANRAALRVAAGALIVNMLTSLPALFLDVSAGIKALVGVSVLVTVVAVGLIFAPAQRSVPVLD